MLLTLATTGPAASDLSYLLHKRPDRLQSFDLSFGKAHVFYPEMSAERTQAALLLDVDPVGMVRGKSDYLLGQYVNDRPYAASSFMSVAIAQVFGSALAGRCKDRPELIDQPLPLEATLHVLPVRSGEGSLQRMFEPLGYEVSAVRHPLDEQFPEWGESPYFSVTLRGTLRLSHLLSHLYVLIPVFDNAKHYYIGNDELEKLLAKGASWLAEHPEKEFIARRYLKHRSSLVRQALARLTEESPDETEEPSPRDRAEEVLEKTISLNEQRLQAVAAELLASGATTVLDLGCGEGRLLQRLASEKQFEHLLGVDVSVRALEIAARRLKFEQRIPTKERRADLLQGALTYRDRRLEGYDAAAVVEVIEHLDPPRLSAFERVLFECARPKTAVITTPNREYNVKWESLPAGKFRHSDHRFEWTRTEFQAWATRVAERHGYAVRFASIGPEDAELGSPTQMGVFHRA
jgi:3' terminal RNA ribose 2'-O-methyltransferase Hen1